MKIQDVIFVLVAAFLLYKQNPRWLLLAGCTCFLISLPLFALWVFFTAQRLIWYGAGFFLFSGILLLIQLRKER